MKIIIYLFLILVSQINVSFAYSSDRTSPILQDLEQIASQCRSTSTWQDEALCFRENVDRILDTYQGNHRPSYSFKCTSSNVFGKYATGGGCNPSGCYYPEGGCNPFGCWYKGGSCTAFGCTQESPKTKQACE